MPLPGRPVIRMFFGLNTGDKSFVYSTTDHSQGKIDKKFRLLIINIRAALSHATHHFGRVFEIICNPLCYNYSGIFIKKLNSDFRTGFLALVQPMTTGRVHLIPVTIFVFITGSALVLPLLGSGTAQFASGSKMEKIKLPDPQHTTCKAIEEALFKRRLVKEYKNVPISCSDLSQVLWAGQGIEDGKEKSPSAEALYPLEIYAIAGNVSGIPAGVYQYRPHTNELARIAAGDMRDELAKAALGRRSIKTAAVVIVVSAVYVRTTTKYGEKGIRYAHMEAGHAAQNISLQAVALNLGSAMIGSFHDSEVKKIMRMEDREQPIYIIPVGRI